MKFYVELNPFDGSRIAYKNQDAKVAYDAPHADLDSAQGRDKSHIGWQTAGKTGVRLPARKYHL
ncbi:polymorphic toxin type 47 domain-containing protein [Burkholderia ambifaria]|uniref:polymorphic toxin type 47 domain-containing protein n=1 Tax=Burkholderia ambifaria TaxID=152480 RepID=UPI001E4D274D|nr:polymorphic toxin type 47 domain-containing protein [Burkholderia ambifaria]UEP23553.1 polymorphic toxin type 47 domain-containing protein [Burkholderia ambifaria]WAS56651.1 polymorphic toxin type 47 domain-containing protein [Burkholderia ambifaria]